MPVMMESSRYLCMHTFGQSLSTICLAGSLMQLAGVPMVLLHVCVARRSPYRVFSVRVSRHGRGLGSTKKEKPTAHRSGQRSAGEANKTPRQRLPETGGAAPPRRSVPNCRSGWMRLAWVHRGHWRASKTRPSERRKHSRHPSRGHPERHLTLATRQHAYGLAVCLASLTV